MAFDFPLVYIVLRYAKDREALELYQGGFEGYSGRQNRFIKMKISFFGRFKAGVNPAFLFFKC